MRRHFHICVIVLGMITLGACSDGTVPESEQTVAVKNTAEIPFGSWTMYGSSSGLMSEETIEIESTVLALADSTYSLTFQRMDINLVYVESGRVTYNRRRREATFAVMSSTGMDFSAGEPRKLVDVTEIVPFQRDPGTYYTMEWLVEDNILTLAASGYENTYFIKVGQ